MNDNDKQAAKDTLKEVRKNQSSVIKEAKSIGTNIPLYTI